MKIVSHTGESRNIPRGTTVSAIFVELADIPPHTVAALFNNQLISLSASLDEDGTLVPLTMTSIEGRRIYQKSLSLVLLKAFYDLFPGKRIKIMHSISKGLYCTAELDRILEVSDVRNLKKRMQQIISDDLPFQEIVVSRERAVKYFKKINLSDKTRLLNYSDREKICLSKLHKVRDLCFYPLLPSTGMLKTFDLTFYPPGLILRFPRTHSPNQLPDFQEQKKLFAIFNEDTRWSRILETTNVGELDASIDNGSISELIKISEALHEKKIAHIADVISERIHETKFILIAGPSSSGKTTFAKRLAIQLRVNGIKTASISTDNYFLSREETPRDEFGDYDFESLEALDLELFNTHLIALLEGKEIEMPKFSFSRGKRRDRGTRIHIPREMPVVIEGIHSLNPKLTSAIPRTKKYMIYISALTQLNLDDYNRIPTTDNRLLRRIVRDHHFRGYSALDTLKRWPSVRKGEDTNIFPFQEMADTMFNSALIYELAVIKGFAKPLLDSVRASHHQYNEARRLSGFLDHVLGIESREVPPTSILREFIGQSTFEY